MIAILQSLLGHLLKMHLLTKLRMFPERPWLVDTHLAQEQDLVLLGREKSMIGILGYRTIPNLAPKYPGMVLLKMAKHLDLDMWSRIPKPKLQKRGISLKHLAKIRPSSQGQYTLEISLQTSQVNQINNLKTTGRTLKIREQQPHLVSKVFKVYPELIKR